MGGGLQGRSKANGRGAASCRMSLAMRLMVCRAMTNYQRGGMAEVGRLQTLAQCAGCPKDALFLLL